MSEDQGASGSGGSDQTDEALPVVTLKSQAVSVSLDDVGPAVGAAVTPAPHPTEPFLVRHRWWVLGGSIVVAVLALVLAWFLLFHDTSKSEAVEVLIVPSSRVSAISADVGNATSVAGFNRASKSVPRARRTIETARQTSLQIRDDQVRSQTLALLDSEDALLDAYGELDSVDRLRSLESADVAEKIDDAADEVDDAVASLKSLALDEAPRPYPDERSIKSAVRSTGSQMGN
ncbi:MAG: hypothetical protein ACRDKE_01390 [Solirubrobacterales bacterium]